MLSARLPAGILRRGAIWAALLCLQQGLAPAAAGGVSVRVLDGGGAPVPEVAVSLKALDAAPAARESPRAFATMDQSELAFDPHVLVVQTGTRIDFPNSDEVRHHVYSFSPTKRFNFSVDSGTIRQALEFDEPGIVTLACNIHDRMLAYIVVVDTPHFARTDGLGTAEFASLPPGRYALSIWTPRARSKDLPEPVVVEFVDGETVAHEHRFERLYAPHQHSETSLKWAY